MRLFGTKINSLLCVLLLCLLYSCSHILRKRNFKFALESSNFSALEDHAELRKDELKKQSWLVSSDYTGDRLKDFVFLMKDKDDLRADLILLKQSTGGFVSEKISDVNLKSGTVELKNVSYGESYWINWDESQRLSKHLRRQTKSEIRCVVFTNSAILVAIRGEYKRILSWHSGQEQFLTYKISKSKQFQNYDSNRLQYECGFE